MSLFLSRTARRRHGLEEAFGSAGRVGLPTFFQARLLAQELKQKGISSAGIESALTQADEHALALACLHRKRRRWRRFKGRERRQKMLAHLSHKGFAYHESCAAIDAFRDPAD